MPDPTDEAATGSDSIDFLSAALGYARRGWRVLPVAEGDKRPALTDWPTLATTDARQLADWWLDKPARNIGLATGRESGFFVLDIDPKSNGDSYLVQLELEHGPLPKTYSVRTGSGGWHYYFLMPDFELGNSPGQLKGTGIDVRGERGQVVAPPSVTAIGSYSVLEGAPVAAAPEWLLELIRPRTLSLVGGTDVERVAADDRACLESYVERALQAATEEVSDTRGGGRNQALNDQVLGLAGIAAHDADLVPMVEVYGRMRDACGANGYIAEDGMHAFDATFRSAWSAGLERPRREWPPVDRHAGLDFGPVPGRAAGLPVVRVSSRKLNELVDEVLGNLVAANDVEPQLFGHGSELVKVVGQPARTSALDVNTLAYECDVHMHFERDQPRGGTAIANAPSKVVETIMSLPEKSLPSLTRLSYTPYFAPSGRLVTEPGYDAEAQTFYSPAPDLVVPAVPSSPTQLEVEAALELVRREVLHDFPFVSDADRAHALTLMLLPFVRDLIAGPTPLHDIEAPTPGSGKGLLMKVLLMPGVGGRHLTIAAAGDPEEWEKRLVSFLRLTPQALVIDNVNDKVSSGFLCTALTEPEVTSRLLGSTAHVTIPVSTTWVMTANNPKFSDEVARRTLRIRVDAQVERPEDRTGFRHADLLGWCLEHRGELIAACCTIVQGWVRAGMPELVPAKPLGSFEHWHAVMGGLLDYLGVPGLLGNKEEFLTASDDESIAWSSLVALLRRDLEGEWTSAEVAELVLEQGIAIDLGRGENKALMMGRELAKQRDRWHDGMQFQKRMLSGRTMWRLVGKPNLD